MISHPESAILEFQDHLLHLLVATIMRLIITLLSHRVGSLIMWLFCHLEGTLLKWVQLRGSGGPVLLPRGNNYLGNWHSQKRAISTDRRISLSSCLIRSNRDFWSLTGLKNNKLKIKQGENAFPCNVIHTEGLHTIQSRVLTPDHPANIYPRTQTVKSGKWDPRWPRWPWNNHTRNADAAISADRWMIGRFFCDRSKDFWNQLKDASMTQFLLAVIRVD